MASPVSRLPGAGRASDTPAGPIVIDLTPPATAVSPVTVGTAGAAGQGRPGWRDLNALRWFGGGLLALLCVGLFGWTVLRGREPAAVTVRPLAAGSGAEIRVYVSGAVATPGVYRLLQGDRVDDAIRAAGGLTDEADSSRLNLAQRVRDEQRLDVPFQNPSSGLPAANGDANGSAAAPPPASTRPAGTSGTGGTAPPRATATPRPPATPRPSATARAEPTARPSTTARPTGSPAPTARPDGKVNVNTATAAQLEKLPGLGDVSARRIVEYRSTNGPIRSLEQLRQAGISDALLRRAADFLAFDDPS